MTIRTRLPNAQDDYSMDWGSQLIRSTDLNLDLVYAQLTLLAGYPNLRAPNVTTAQKNLLINALPGWQVYDTTLNKLCVYCGTGAYSATFWQTVTSV